MKSKARRNLSLVTLLLLSWTTVGLVAALSPRQYIDPFPPGQCVATTAGTCPVNDPFFTDPTILGDERDVDLVPLSGPQHTVKFVDTGFLTYANDALSKSTALIAWDGSDGSLNIDPAGLIAQTGGLDLSGLECPGGGWVLHFDQVYLDLSARYCMRLYSDEDRHSQWCSGIVYGESYGAGGAGVIPFLLTEQDFAPVGGSGADYANVGAISLLLDSSLEAATDLILGPLTIGCPKATAVDLASFEALTEDCLTCLTRVELVWETATEVDNLGFYLYRAVKPELKRGQGAVTAPVLERLNDSLIPSQVAPGSPVGATYSWRDTTAEAGVSYYYWLEDVDVQGQTTLHGPVMVADH